MPLGRGQPSAFWRMTKIDEQQDDRDTALLGMNLPEEPKKWNEQYTSSSGEKKKTERTTRDEMEWTIENGNVKDIQY
jgi:hypothetical protein